MLIVPVGFALMAVRQLLQVQSRWYVRLVAAAFPLAAVLVGVTGVAFGAAVKWPLIAVLVASGALGAPIFTVLGGVAAVLFLSSGGSTAVMANECYTMLSGPVIPTIPLFALTGFILSESKAGERLVAFFRAAFGWLPGGLAVMAVVVCAFFTTFTGASGVTILALGGLLSYALTESRYDKSLSTGLLTASGSIGLLFPPSLPIILYGVIAHVNIKHLFVAGLVPGLLMMTVVALFGVRHASGGHVPRVPFNRAEFFRTLRVAAWELALPVAILFLYLRGITTLVETSAMSVLYALAITMFVHRDTRIRDVPRVMLKCLSTVGGILVILGVARGLSYYIVDAEVPTQLTAWCSAHIGSKYAFLALLNLALLLTGCFMDIFSAIVVVVPLVVPLANAFGVDPIHLGIIFLANLELGYLTPPVGMNLFLSSYRFGKPMPEVIRASFPMLLVLLVGVLLITYLPILTTFLPDWLG
jgi:tripartite ATP-independent transporter DctM subunit